uniref:Uncharacterized protein n=1 Tax=Arundo donax TaxID=35708 RepID=A0A0A9C644_ARUDO
MAIHSSVFVCVCVARLRSITFTCLTAAWQVATSAKMCMVN